VVTKGKRMRSTLGRVSKHGNQRYQKVTQITGKQRVKNKKRHYTYGSELPSRSSTNKG